MILVKPSYIILDIMGKQFSEQSPLSIIELAGRTCYKSEEKMTEESSKSFVKMILKRGHESVIEHSAMSVKFIVDRGVTHELVRHRLCAFSQESTRYCNYKGGTTFVIPPWVDLEEGKYDWSCTFSSKTDNIWARNLLHLESAYKDLLNYGWTPQQARSVLPNSLKTEIVVTANFREWRHIFKLRCSKAAHPQMREIMIPLLEDVKNRIPVIFDNLTGE